MRARPIVLLALAAFASLLATASAEGAARWSVTAQHGPQHVTPGGQGQYYIQVYNIGDSDSSGATTVTVALRPGLVATKTENRSWACSGSTAVTCTHGASVPAPGPQLQPHGEADPLYVNFAVSPAATGAEPTTVTVAGGGGAPVSISDPTPVSMSPAGFGMSAGSFAADVFDAERPDGSPWRQAGSHPFELRLDFATNLKLSQDPTTDPPTPYFEPDGTVRTIDTKLPIGLVGNPMATPRCAGFELLGGTDKGGCPANTQVGTIDLQLQDGKFIGLFQKTNDVPVFNMVPPAGHVAALAFAIVNQQIWITASLDPTDGHAVRTRIEYQTEVLTLRRAQLTLWGVPADPAHDPLRLDAEAAGGSLEAYGAPYAGPIRPFLTMPTQCDTVAGSIRQRLESWQVPGAFTPWERGAPIRATDCGDPRIDFQPSIAIQPTSREAASPTGLDVELTVPQKNDTVGEAADLYAQSGSEPAIVTPNLRDAVTRLPQGMAVNPSAADGLVGCSQADVGLDDNEPPRCPDSSKIGVVEIDSPLVPDTLKGFIYQARQHENPHGSLLGFYTVAQGDGLTIKLAARVAADPETGRLTTTYLDNPQLAFEHYRLHFWGGERAPLVNPPTCGEFAGSGTFSAWNSSLPAVTATDVTRITSGPNGSPCPDGLAGRPFAPGLRAGSATPLAGSFSDFGLEVSREDGSQELRGLEATLPPGMLAKLAGVPYCPEAAIASISAAAGSGRGERLSPSCPEAALVGHSDAAAGAGSLPFHNPGDVYLTGPYRGAPLGLAAVTPIVAGPLDLGSLVVRAALHVDPVTAQVKAVSDPIPDRLVVEGNGFPLNLRSVRVSMDRPAFALNPTSCAELGVGTTLTSLQGAVARPSERFQLGGCSALGFKPRLFTRLFGGTGRGAHPKLRAVLQMPRGSNVRRAVVSLPRSVFLEQANIRTVCTRVQFRADACPKGSIYGRAAAKSPLLDYVLRGPVYLRSSDNVLPDLVAVLRGPASQPIEVELAGRIDSVRGGIRTVFEAAPDAPVSRFVLKMEGGKRQGLLVNSRDLCRRPSRATAAFRAHNGRTSRQRPRLKASCAKNKQHRTRSVRSR